MYESVTRGIRVRASPQYIEQQSRPEDGYYFWAYTIEIANDSAETVQLRSRWWRITDGRGRTEDVRGPGVVGETPTLAPGQAFTYTSGCPLPTPSGIMAGSYQMADAEGALFDVTIPAFSLDSPFSIRSMN